MAKKKQRLYKDISLDEQTMDLYPDDGYLPGIEETVIRDNRSDGEDVLRVQGKSFLNI